MLNRRFFLSAVFLTLFLLPEAWGQEADAQKTFIEAKQLLVERLYNIKAKLYGNPSPQGGLLNIHEVIEELHDVQPLFINVIGAYKRVDKK